MRSEPLISVVVPVFNVEQYLHKCLNSIISQTWKNLEIILIDDGSTDRSGHICDEYALTDNRIIVVHNIRSGVSVSRNIGVEISSGQYVGFVDSDDWIEPTMYADLYEGFKFAPNVLLTNGMIYLYDEDRDAESLMRPSTWGRDVPNVIKAQDFGKAMLSETSNHYVWCKLYKKEVFANLRFREGRVDEDTLIMYELGKQICRTSINVVEINKTVYHYRIRRNSLCTHTKNLLILDRMENLKEIYTDTKTYFPDLNRYVEERILSTIFWFIKTRRADLRTLELDRKFFRKSLQYASLRTAFNYLSHRDLLKYILLRIFPYRLIFH